MFNLNKALMLLEISSTYPHMPIVSVTKKRMSWAIVTLSIRVFQVIHYEVFGMVGILKACMLAIRR